MKRKRKVIFVDTKDDDEMTRLFWKKRSPEERLSAVEFLREQCYIIQGYKTVPSIVRELHIVER
jgi:hypothetical protein